MDPKFSNSIHKGWTVYTRSCCKYCRKVRKLLDIFDLPYNLVDCDNCLIIPELQEEFNEFLHNLCGCEPQHFPLKTMYILGEIKKLCII